jgi:hypothetical protein
VLDRHVRSDEDDVEQRRTEEAGFLEPIRHQQHPVREALSDLGATWSQTTLLRGRRPFWVMTEARFRRADDMVAVLLSLLELPGRSELWAQDGLTTLEVVIELDEAAAASDEWEGVEALAGHVDDYTIMLTAGEFVTATGFAIDGDTARLLEPDAAELETAGRLVLSLTWAERF